MEAACAAQVLRLASPLKMYTSRSTLVGILHASALVPLAAAMHLPEPVAMRRDSCRTYQGLISVEYEGMTQYLDTAADGEFLFTCAQSSAGLFQVQDCGSGDPLNVNCIVRSLTVDSWVLSDSRRLFRTA